MNNKEKTILITGSNGELGSGLVDYLLERGFTSIMCHYHNQSDRISKVISKYGLTLDKIGVCADLTSEKEVLAMKAEIQSKAGNVFALVNLAGGSSNSMSWNISLEEFKRILDINLTSTFLCSKIFIPEMRKAMEGRIINVSSITASIGVVGASHYCAAKAGINGLTKSLALELADKNITVNTISLGYFDRGLINEISVEKQLFIKEKIPMKSFGNISNLGRIIQYLCSAESSYTTGQTLHINGGMYLS